MTSHAIGIVLLALAGGGCAALMKAKKECDANIADLRTLPDAPPAFDFTGRWSCIYEGSDGSNGTEALDIVQRGATATVSARDGYGNAAVLDGRIAGTTLVLTRSGDRLTTRVEGSPGLLAGVIDSGFTNDCGRRRYTCNRR